jgi:putative transposase
MDSIHLSEDDRKTLLEIYRHGTDPRVRLRCHILLLLDGGLPWATITSVLFTSPATIARVKRDFLRRGIAAAFSGPGGRPPLAAALAALVLFWVLSLRPAAFGLARSRWSCEALAVILEQQRGVAVSAETVRRWLRQGGLVWRRPRPTLRPKDPQRQQKLNALRQLLRELPEDETAVFMDEVEVNTNPKIGCAWMPRGEQSEVATPGTNQKRVLAGSLHWRTGRLFVTEGLAKEGRTAALFCRHLDELRRRLRRYRVIHVVCDNVKTHKAEGSRLVKQYLKEHGERLKVHYLPVYSPECNPVERVWWRLHEAVTRNHSCTSMEGLLELTFRWLAERRTFNTHCPCYDEPTPQ